MCYLNLVYKIRKKLLNFKLDYILMKKNIYIQLNDYTVTIFNQTKLKNV